MTCKDIREMMQDEIKGVLTSYEREEMEQHLRECPECSKEKDETVGLVALLAGLNAPDMPSGFLDGVLDKISNPVALSRYSAPRFSLTTGEILLAAGALIIAGTTLLRSFFETHIYSSGNNFHISTKKPDPVAQGLMQLPKTIEKFKPYRNIKAYVPLDEDAVYMKGWEKKAGKYGYRGNLKKYKSTGDRSHRMSVDMLQEAKRMISSGAGDGVNKGIQMLEKASITGHEVEPIEIDKDSRRERR